LYWGCSDQWKVSASLSLFLKSEKISALLYEGKGPGYRPFRDFQPVPSAYQQNHLFPQPTSLRHRSQIMEGPVLGCDYTSSKLVVLLFLSYITNNSLFISMCILRDLHKKKNPRALCPGELPQFYMFPHSHRNVSFL
jgi:hypothetical protein